MAESLWLGADQLLLDDLLEGFERLGSDDGMSIDHNRGGAAHADLLGGRGLLLHQVGILARIQALVECLRV